MRTSTQKAMKKANENILLERECEKVYHVGKKKTAKEIIN